MHKRWLECRSGSEYGQLNAVDTASGCQFQDIVTGNEITSFHTVAKVDALASRNMIAQILNGNQHKIYLNPATQFQPIGVLK